MKILLIQQKMIGDVLVSSLLCEHLKDTFPNCTIHYVVNEHTTAVVENNPFIDKIVVFENEYKSNRLKFLRFLQTINKEKYDVTVDVYGKLESNLITLFSKAKIRIAYRKWYSKIIYTHPVSLKSRQLGSNFNTIDDRLALLAPLINKIISLEKKPQIYLTQNEIDEARFFLKEKGIDFQSPLIMIGILGSEEKKTYPLEYMAKVIEYIAENTNAILLFNYIPYQSAEAKRVFEICNVKAQNKIMLDAFATDLRKFLAILGLCKCYIGNEGGSTNMAKALNVPTFSIFAPWIDKTGWHTFGGDENIAIHVEDYKKGEISKMSKSEVHKQTSSLYKMLKPALFETELKSFLKKCIISN